MAEWKATAAVMSQRVKEVKNLLLVGKTRCDILEYGGKWGIERAQIDNITAVARLELHEVNQADFKENRMLVLNNLWQTYQRAIEANNIKAQIGCLSQISKVTGIEMAPAEQAPRARELTDQQLDEAYQQEAVH